MVTCNMTVASTVMVSISSAMSVQPARSIRCTMTDSAAEPKIRVSVAMMILSKAVRNDVLGREPWTTYLGSGGRGKGGKCKGRCKEQEEQGGDGRGREGGWGGGRQAGAYNTAKAARKMVEESEMRSLNCFGWSGREGTAVRRYQVIARYHTAGRDLRTQHRSAQCGLGSVVRLIILTRLLRPLPSVLSLPANGRRRTIAARRAGGRAWLAWVSLHTEQLQASKL